MARRCPQLGLPPDDAQSPSSTGRTTSSVTAVRGDIARQLKFYARALRDYDIFHSANAHGLRFGHSLQRAFVAVRRVGRDRSCSSVPARRSSTRTTVASMASPRRRSRLGCRSRRATTARGSTCRTSAATRRTWPGAKLRNSLADYQITIGGNRADYNDDPTRPRGSGVLLPRPGVLEPGPADPDRTTGCALLVDRQDLPLGRQLRRTHVEAVRCAT